MCGVEKIVCGVDKAVWDVLLSDESVMSGKSCGEIIPFTTCSMTCASQGAKAHGC